MRFILYIIAFLTFSLNTQAQLETHYSILKGGLSIRETPSDKAAVIGKIPFGQAFQLEVSSEIIPIELEGMQTYWVPVNYNGKHGYVIHSYTFPYKITVESIENLSDFVKAQFTPMGKEWQKTRTYKSEQDDYNFTTVYKKQLFTNGILFSTIDGHEYIYESIHFPDINVYQAYNFVKLIQYFNYPFLKNENLKNGNYTVKHTDGNEIKWKVSIGTIDSDTYPESIRAEWCDGACNMVMIQDNLDGIIINLSSGL